ncbi:hypothetical protein ACFE04_010699 [Oxalis oulophora]
MAETCLASIITPPTTTSTSTLFATPKTQQHFTFLSKPIFKRFNLSLNNNNKHKLIVPFVAQTSDWAPEQGEEDQEGVVSETDVVVEETVVSEGFEEEEETSFVEPSEEAKLYVGNLPFDVDSEQLAQLFNQAGVVEIAEVIYNRETDVSRGFGFVTMSTVEEAEKAAEIFHRYDLNGRLLNVNKAAPRGSRAERPPRAFESSSSKIYVGNLAWGVDDGRLEQVFSEHGKVVEAKVIYDRESGRSRGFGFVTMSSETEVNDAIAALDGQSLDGRAIRVNVAEQKPRRASFY